MTDPGRLVWDLPLRAFHWLLAASVLASWLTGLIGSELRQFHMWLGFWMLGLLSFRLAWGLVGTRHARFASFVPRPGRLLAHARGLLRGEPPQTVGHDPLGSLLVYALLFLIAAQAVSGLFIEDDIMHQGPWHDAVSRDTAERFSDLHHNLYYFIVALAALHVVAVLYLSLRKRIPLIRAMITGRKPAALVGADEAIPGSRIGVATVVVAVVAAFVYWLVVIAPPG